MTTGRDQKCHAVQLAVMARLDGEPAPARGDGDEAHLAGCERCREAIARMAQLHARLDALSYDQAATNLWPAIRGRIARRRPSSAPEHVALGALAALVLAWRTAQLVFDVPVPILNALVPLTVVILIGWWIAGDPLAIQPAVLEGEQESA
jgi:predicted anti-sigma-YlaC factor YlaD